VPEVALHGIVPPVVTPFRDDERIDYTAWQRIIDGLLAAGVHGLFVCGSTGEFHALDFEERSVAVRFCRQAVARRVPVYANVGCVTTRETIRLAQFAQGEGVDVLAVITPYYARVSQDELFEHYWDVCRSVRSPVIGYNFPQHGGTGLLPETVGRIAAACENFVGIKDASGNLAQTAAYRTCAPGRELTVFVGPETMLLDALETGCDGAVSSSMNIAPKLFLDLYRAFRAGNREEAARLQPLATLLGESQSLHTFPGPAKAAMAMIGQPAGPCRKPILPMPEAARQKLASVIDRLREEGYIAAARQQRGA